MGDHKRERETRVEKVRKKKEQDERRSKDKRGNKCKEEERAVQESKRANKLNKYAISHESKGGVKEVSRVEHVRRETSEHNQGMLKRAQGKSQKDKETEDGVKKEIFQVEEKVHQRLSCTEATRGVHLSAPRSPRRAARDGDTSQLRK